MKMLRTLVLLLGATTQLCAQIAEVGKLSTIIKNANADSVEKTERLAAIYFHEKINQYRVSLKKTSLGWDDTVWLAARNHCNWMVANNELSHEEKPGTASFNGQWPGDRYSFASNSKGNCNWSGENALYNWSYSSSSSCQQNALNMANHSFEQWKNSPGHNANMLKDASRVHGVAFRIGKEGQVWATDLFCYAPSYSPIVEKPAPLFSKTKTMYVYTTVDTPYVVETPPTVIAQTKAKPDAKQKFVSASTKYVKLDLAQTSSDLESGLYSLTETQRNKTMVRAAQHHAQYMAANSKLAHDEKKQKRQYYAGSPQKRIVKASRGAKMVHKSSTQFVESIALVVADAATLNTSELSKNILDALDKERGEASENSNAVGFGIVIKRVKNELRIYAVREEQVKK